MARTIAKAEETNPNPATIHAPTQIAGMTIVAYLVKLIPNVEGFVILLTQTCPNKNHIQPGHPACRA